MRILIAMSSYLCVWIGIYTAIIELCPVIVILCVYVYVFVLACVCA